MTVLMPLIGYARVSTEDQTPLPQSQALKSAGCAEIHEEQASGGNRARPVLARVLERIGKGDTLLVVRIDRLARSLSHLLEVIERLQAKGAFFRSIRTRSTPVFVKAVVRRFHAASLISVAPISVSGLSQTGPAGCQLRVLPDQRCGFCARAIA